jgi:hypothetical protein
VGYEVKGAALRAYLKQLERKGWLSAVSAQVSPEMRAQFVDPPPSSSWMDAAPIEALMAAVEEQHGEDAVRALSYDTQTDMVPILRPVLEGVLRIFGASPATMYARMELLTRTSLRGVEFAWHVESAQAGDLEVRFIARRELPRRAFVSFIASFQLILEFCGKKGMVSLPELNRDGTGARYHIEWR